MVPSYPQNYGAYIRPRKDTLGEKLEEFEECLKFFTIVNEAG